MESADETTCKGRILIIDDELPIGQLLQQWLTGEGYYARHAKHFEEVKTCVEEETFDVATCDIMMPDVDGLQVLAWLRENRPDLAVMMATALGDLDTVLAAMRQGAISYLLKPFNMDLVTEEIGRAMERQRLIAENRAYQRDLEQRVEEQTAEIRAAHLALERHVLELEGRDRLVQCQLAGPSVDEACDVILQVMGRVLGLRQAAIYRPNAEGVLEPAASAHFGEDSDDIRYDEVPRRELDEVADACARGAYESGEAVGDVSEGQGAIPMICQENTFGALWVCVTQDASQGQAEVLHRLGQQAALTLWSAGISDALDDDGMALHELLQID